MELADLQAIHAEYPIKVGCLKHPKRCHDFVPKIAQVNARLAAISDDEFQAFLAQVNRNPKSIAFVVEQFRRLKQVAARERTCLDDARQPELRRLLTQDVKLLRRICREIRAHYARDARVEVVGYGEITTSLVLSDSTSLDSRLHPHYIPAQWVCKSLPKFPTMDEFHRYERAFYQYVALLRRAGLDMPEQKLVVTSQDKEGIRAYVVQRRLDSAHIGNALMHTLDQAQALALLKKVILKIGAVFATDLGPNVRLALDGQISNWHSPDVQPTTTLVYIDTSTPLFRVNGQEQLNPEIFLKNTPSFLRAILRAFFLQDVLDAYYNVRTVLFDLIANLFKEGRADLVAPAVEMVNEMLGNELHSFDITPLGCQEVEAYYRQDAFVWSFYQTARRMDRFVIEKILGRRYAFRLPGKIRR